MRTPRLDPESMPETPLVGPRTSRLRAYYELTKPGIATFVMLTAGASYYVGAGGQVAWIPLIHTLLGTVVATAGALALNQYIEREVDGRMKRTRTRPLPSRRLAPPEALVFGILLTVAGCAHLWATVGVLPATLTLASAVAYNFVYTPLKSRSYLATFAGAFPGAMPALIGWSAATGSVTLGALVLFTIAFLWQLPHVLALAWLLREDYARAGFLLSPSNPRTVGRQMIVNSALLIPVSLSLTPLGITGVYYAVGALILGVVVLWWSIEAHRTMEMSRVRRLFLGSLAYQPLLLLIMVLDTNPLP